VEGRAWRFWYRFNSSASELAPVDLSDDPGGANADCFLRSITNSVCTRLLNKKALITPLLSLPRPYVSLRLQRAQISDLGDNSGCITSNALCAPQHHGFPVPIHRFACSACVRCTVTVKVAKPLPADGSRGAGAQWKPTIVSRSSGLRPIGSLSAVPRHKRCR
jgi:hypothetical protein